MTSDAPMDHGTLSSKKVSELREICKKRGLMVSGKKSELIERIMDDYGLTSGEEIVEEEALIMEDDSEILDSEEISPAIIDDSMREESFEILEAEVVEAELVSSEDVDPDESGDDSASLVITLPTISSMSERWKSIAAVVIVVILVGALTTNILQRNAGFIPKNLHFGDEMSFFVSDTEVNIVGDEMLDLVRDSTGGILEDACGQLTAEMTGTGTVSISDGYESGSVGTTDSLGRSGFLAVEKDISMNLDTDFEGKTWRDPGICGNLGWSLPDNLLSIDSTSWIEIEESELKRRDTSATFKDGDSITTNLRAVSYELSLLGGVGNLLPTLLFPLTPIELYDFFGDVEIKEGARSSDPEINWKSDWSWTVKEEFSDSSYGLVYPIEMEHVEIGKCYGHAHLTLLVSKNDPWPVQQEADIILNKDLKTNDCDFLVSSISEELFPEGSLTVRMKISKSASIDGENTVDWGREYLKPSAGEDRLGSSTERNWVDSMVDESEIRDFNIEEATSCLKTEHSSSKAAQSLISGGYIWKSHWSQPTGLPEWNLSWVDEDDNSGWIILRKIIDSGSENDCEIVDYGNDGSIYWNRDSIPSTQTISLLEGRFLEDGRYPELRSFLINSDNTDSESWHPEAMVGYRLSVTEENEYLGLLPGNLGDGKVTMTASRNWESGQRDNSVNSIMDAETGEMAIWYLIDRPL